MTHHPTPAPAHDVPGTAPRLFALVPCAGSGSRARTDGPKQYAPLEGRPVVAHTLAALGAVERLSAIVVVVAAGDPFVPVSDARVRVAPCGGPSRAASVLGGLAQLRALGATETDWVLVHDAARCLVTPALVNALIDACLDDAVGGLLALPLADTLKAAHEGRAVATVDRSDKWTAQTPQMVRIGLLQAALAARAPDFAGVTDEASALEALGYSPRLVPGSPENIKLTYPPDFALARAILRSRVT